MFGPSHAGHVNNDNSFLLRCVHLLEVLDSFTRPQQHFPAKSAEVTRLLLCRGTGQQEVLWRRPSLAERSQGPGDASLQLLAPLLLLDAEAMLFPGVMLLAFTAHTHTASTACTR